MEAPNYIPDFLIIHCLGQLFIVVLDIRGKIARGLGSSTGRGNTTSTNMPRILGLIVENWISSGAAEELTLVCAIAVLLVISNVPQKLMVME